MDAKKRLQETVGSLQLEKVVQGLSPIKGTKENGGKVPVSWDNLPMLENMHGADAEEDSSDGTHGPLTVRVETQSSPSCTASGTANYLQGSGGAGDVGQGSSLSTTNSKALS